MKFDPVPVVKSLLAVMAEIPLQIGQKPEPLQVEHTIRVTPPRKTLIPAELVALTATESKGTACIPCTRDHVSTTAAVLAEAIRFARTDGIDTPEVLDRLDIAEQELNALERIDAHPAKLAQLPEGEKELMDSILPKVRELRHAIQGIDSPERLEQVATEAHTLAQEMRLRMLKARGIDLERLRRIAQKTEQGEITRDEAREQVREFLTEAEESEE